MTTKKYGLLLPDKGKQPAFQASRNVFGNESDSEEETSKKKSILLQPSDIINRQAKISQEKAIKEDPTVYQYDEIYDDVITKKEKAKTKMIEEKKPKYIENLLKSANKRKIENERRIERQIQKEREKEGDEFRDKEVFVTSAYKKKLEEMTIEEEREKREEYLESIGDVTKQNDLGGFYRHLYEQKLGVDENKQTYVNVEKDIKHDGADPNQSKKRNYRKRKISDSKSQLSEGELAESDEEINRVNLDDIKIAKRSKQIEENIDADSDFSIDESSDEDDAIKEDKKPSKQKQQKIDTQKDDVISDNDKLKIVVEPKKIEEVVIKEIQSKPKIDIWKKRTVGVIFEEALKRYYERKTARAS